jgi:hypothetical protein
MNGYDLSRNWFNWCFDNPEKITPSHTALYFFCIEHCNRLGWKEKFGLPTTMAKEAIGIRSYNTYIKTLNDLIDFGFIKMVEKSKNQYSSNIIALSKFNKAHDKALDKALIKHTTKQCESTVQSIDSIDKQVTINKEQRTILFSEFWELYDKKVGSKTLLEKKWIKLTDFEREQIMVYLPKYKKTQPDKQYRKNPETFLNQRGWEHELIGYKEEQNHNTKGTIENNDW